MYNLVVAGGTFDRLHKGHKDFLRFIFGNSKKVLLGITSDTYIRENKHIDRIESYQKRRKAVVTFIKTLGMENNVTIAPIDSVMYPKKWENLPIEAIIATKDSEKGAQYINDQRHKDNLLPLPILLAPLTLHGKENISSTRIRKGEINSEGIAYLAKEWFANDLVLPEKARHFFKKPFGKLIPDINADVQSQQIATVGDYVTRYFNEKGIHQKISIIDFVIERHLKFSDILQLNFTGTEKMFYATNPPGHITVSLFKEIAQMIKLIDTSVQIVLQVNGEEDLAVLPLLLALPLGWTIFYGQPHKGIVQLKVTQKNKDKAYSFLKHFSTTTRGS